MGWKLIAPGPTGPQASFDPVESTRPQFRKGLRWPLPAQRAVRIWDLDHLPYTIDVEFVQGDAGPVATGIAIRRNFAYDEKQGFADGLELTPVSGRDVRRMPLDRVLAAALASVSGDPEWGPRAAKALTPRGRPKRGRSSKFYVQIADVYRQLAQRDVGSPVQEIARRMDVPPNRVHQWVHRAREMGLLEPSSRSRQRRKRDDG